MAYRGTGVPQFGYNESKFGTPAVEQVKGAWLNTYGTPMPAFASTDYTSFTSGGTVSNARVRVGMLTVGQLIAGDTYVVEFTHEFDADVTLEAVQVGNTAYATLQVIETSPAIVSGEKYSKTFVAGAMVNETSILLIITVAAGGSFNITGFSLRPYTAPVIGTYDLPHPIKGGRTETYEPIQEIYENILHQLIPTERMLRFIGEYEFSAVPSATLDVLTNIFNTTTSMQWAPHKDYNMISYQVLIREYKIIPINGLIGYDGLTIKVEAIHPVYKIPTLDNLFRLTNWPRMASVV